MRQLLIFLTLTISTITNGQDTIRLMQYNLLNYGNYWSDCTTGNNNVSNKNEFLQTIIEYVQPDILAVNEIDDNDTYHELLLTDALNVNGVSYWARAYPPNTSSAPIMNEIYYNSEKLTLTGNVAIPNNYRDIDIFKFDVINNQGKDIKLNCVVAHLKAGSSSSDEESRANETNNLMLYLNNDGASGNYTMSGDFNIYGASEQAFQNLLFYPNEEIRFYDPVNQIGEWNNNSYYADYHTQSTHVSGDCPSGGGMDDRFDFILVSDEVLYGTDDIQYIDGSYKAVGQDGEHFNSSINASPDNTSVPSNVLNALYNMSDHLPVIADFKVGENTGLASYGEANFKIMVKNPVRSNLELLLKDGIDGKYQLKITSLQGNQVFNESIFLSKKSKTEVATNSLPGGIYILTISNPDAGNIRYKIMID